MEDLRRAIAGVVISAPARAGTRPIERCANAFADIHADLVELGAPTRLLQAAIRAAVGPACEARRDLGALAIANGVENCIRRTFNAAVAGYQARITRDRAAYRIAREEAKLAAIAWRIQRWITPRLTPIDRTAMLAATATARAELAARSDAAATAMLAELDTRVWSPLSWLSRR